jgi:hypothetical protein
MFTYFMPIVSSALNGAIFRRGFTQNGIAEGELFH